MNTMSLKGHKGTKKCKKVLLLCLCVIVASSLLLLAVDRAPVAYADNPLDVSGTWSGTITITDAKVTGDIVIPADTEGGKPTVIKKEDCDADLQKNVGKAQPLTLVFQPDSATGGKVAIVTTDLSGQKSNQAVAYKLNGNQVVIDATESGTTLHMAGPVTLQNGNYVLSGTTSATYADNQSGGAALVINGTWAVSKAAPPGAAPIVSVSAPTAAIPTSVPAAPASGPQQASVAPPSAPDSSAVPQGQEGAGLGGGLTAGAATYVQSLWQGAPPPGIGNIGQVPGPGGLDQTLTGIVLPGLASIFIGLAGGITNLVTGAPPVAPAADEPAPLTPAPDAPEPPAEPEPVDEPGSDVEGRRAQIRQSMIDARQEGTNASSWLSVLGDTFHGIGQDMTSLWNDGVKGKDWVIDKAGEGVQAVVQAGQDVVNDPTIITDTLSSSLNTVENGVKAAADGAATAGRTIVDAGRDVINDPNIITDTLTGSLNTVESGVKSAGNAIVDFISNPTRMWQTIKDFSGLENFENALDPNRPIESRLRQVGLGVTKLYGALSAGETIATHLEEGVTTVIGREAGGTLETAGTDALANAGQAGAPAVGSEGLFTPGARRLVAAGPDVSPSLDGIPSSQLDAIAEIGRKRGVDIAIRPTNPDALEWLEGGQAVPKPPYVHTTSLNEIDELIGGPQGQKGLVGHFEPQWPPDDVVQNLDPGLVQTMKDRYRSRIADWNDFGDTMSQLQREGKVNVIDGVVHDAATGKPMVSDIDLGGVYMPDGSPAPEDISRMIVKEIRQQSPGVAHPDINSWYAVGSEQHDIMARTMGKHLVGGTPLTTVGVGGTRATYFGEFVDAAARP